MNHLPTEEEDRGFQEGRAVAEYLENAPCVHQTESHCTDCIAAAVNAVNDAFSKPCTCIMECHEEVNCRHFFKNSTPSVSFVIQ